MTEQESVKPSETSKMPKAKVITDLLKAGRAATQDSAEIAGAYGKKVSDAVEKHGVNRKALAIAKSLDKLEPEKLAETMDHLEYYLDVGGLEDRRQSAQRLPMGDQPGEREEDGDDTEAAPKNGRARKPFPAPATAPRD